jgi:hypothetical protein
VIFLEAGNPSPKHDILFAETVPVVRAGGVGLSERLNLGARTRSLTQRERVDLLMPTRSQ